MSKLSTRFGNFVLWLKRGKQHSSATEEAGAVATAVAEEPGADLARRTTKESPIDRLQRGYEEMVDLMGAVRNHMAQQSQRSERLLEMLEGLPDALRSLPEATRNQTRTLDAIQSNLSQQASHSAKLADALNGLAKSTQHHDAAMSAINQQLDASHQCSEQILSSFNVMSGALARIGEENEAGRDLLRKMAEQENKAGDQVRELFIKTQKHVTTMSIVSWALAIVALTVAGFVAVSVSRIQSQPAPGMPVAEPARSVPAQKQSESNVPVIPASTSASKNDLLDDAGSLLDDSTPVAPETGNATAALPLEAAGR